MGTIKNEKTQVRRAGSAATIAAAMAVTVMVSGCAASITSRPFDEKKAGDGIVYRLPAREYSVAVTYELEACSPLIVKAVDVSVSSTLIPSRRQEDWFEVDPKALNQVFSSVDPATIELNNGMLSVVGLKTTGGAAQVVTLAKQVAETLAMSMPSEAKCTPEAIEAIEKLKTFASKRDALEVKREEAEVAMIATPTADAERKVKLARERLADAVGAAAKHRDSALRKTKVYRLTTDEMLTCTAAQTTPPSWTLSKPTVSTTYPEAEELADWFEIKSTVLSEGLKKAFQARLEIRDPYCPGTGVTEAERQDPYAGIYFRGAATATAVITVASGKDDKVYRVLDATQAIPQLGALRRVEMKGSAFGSRNISVAFDETGQLKKYELTSKGMAEAMTASVKEVDAAFAKPDKPSELEKLTDEVNLLKKKKELIDAKAALEAAETGSE